MRISDWSSDVFSSDLRILQAVIVFADRLEARFAVAASRILVRVIFHRELAIARLQRRIVGGALDFEQLVIIDVETHGLLMPLKIGRASCREECVSTCRSRWSP